jgi:hypothetical protein
VGLVWAFTLEENQPDLLREAERLTQESPTGVQEEPDREIRYWHLPEVDWPVADRQIRVVKTVRIEQQRRVTVRGKDAARIKGKTAISLPSTTSTLPISNWARSRPCSFISSVAAVGESACPAKDTLTSRCKSGRG